MRRYAQIAVLFLLGGALLKVALSGAYLRYVRGTLLLPLIIGGAALVAIATANLWREIQAVRTDEQPTITGLRLGGLFRTEMLSAPDRSRHRGLSARRQPAPGRPGARAADPPAGRHAAQAAGWAAAAHEGLDEAPTAADSADVSAVGGEGRNDRTLAVGRPADVPGQAADTAALQPVSPVGWAGSGEPAGVRPAPAGPATRAGWALLAAVLALVLLAPPALGTWPATRAGTLILSRGATPTAGATAEATPAGTTATSGPTAGPTAAPTDASSVQPVSMSLVDYATRATAGGASLAGLQVRLVGFIVAGPHGEPYLARLAIGCCAAGARPVKVGLTGDLPGVLTPDRWVEVVGGYVARTDPDPVNGAPIPYVSVVTVTEVTPPSNPYES
jgi:uncharacterized repeat protein (TIGR03943 family)